MSPTHYRRTACPSHGCNRLTIPAHAGTVPVLLDAAHDPTHGHVTLTTAGPMAEPTAVALTAGQLAGARLVPSLLRYRPHADVCTATTTTAPQAVTRDTSAARRALHR